ncbi:MAG TPA: lantibiotic dehydratase, partial [Thermoanaerobaculia bacterium]
HLHRSLVDQVAHMLVRHPAFRAGLRMSLNETLERGAGGACTFIRPARYGCDESSGMVLLGPPAAMKATLNGPLIDWWIAHPFPAAAYGELLPALARELPEEVRDSVGATVDELLDLGFLCFEWPWAATDPAPAARLLDYLETRPAAAGLAPAAAALRRVLALLAEYTRSDSPSRIIDEANQSMRELLAAAAQLARIDPGISLRTTVEGFFHEDVVVSSRQRSGEVAHLPARQAQALVGDLTPLVRLSNLFCLRLDVLHTFAAAAAERWPGRTEVPLLEFFSATFPLFRDFVRFDAASRPEGPLKPRHFNPRGLAAVDDLLACRQRLAAALAACISEAGGERRLDAAALTRLLDELPPAAAAAREFCAFLQPIGDAGGRWVLNSCFEGAGRMSSRYTLTMTPAMRSPFTTFYAARAAAGEKGDSGELVDLFWPAGFSVNVHALQTPRVITTPGQTLPLAGERRLTLRDLFVGLRGPERLPVLLDARRQRILPVHLGALSFRYLPSLAKFLTLFGPGELRLGRPDGGPRRVAADVESGERHAIGNVIYRRRSWTVEPGGLRRAEGGLAAAAAMLAVNRWRLDRGIPDRVFVTERVGTPPRPWRTKPQYIDFTSCHFVEILRTALERAEERLTLVEALPMPEDLPLAGGRRLAAEIQLDSCGIRDASLSRLPTHRGTSLSAHFGGQMKGVV